MNCIQVTTKTGCFVPNDTEQSKVPVNIQYINSTETGALQGVYIFDINSPLVPIQPSTYLGGGTVHVDCCCPIKQEGYACIDNTAVPVIYWLCPVTGMIDKVLNPATNEIVTEYTFIESCDDCPEAEEFEPTGDQVACASRKLGADFNSNNANEGTHTTGSLYDSNGPIVNWSGTFTVTDNSSNTHTFNDGDTVTGLASGATQQVTYTGWIHWEDAGETYICMVTDKPISANFTVL